MNSTLEDRVPSMAARLTARQPDGQRRQVMHHRWESLLFLHWRISPDIIQATLPRGLHVDTFAGDAFLAIIPFFMRNVRAVGVPSLPWLSAFQELNVRTYVYDRHGTPGIWFYSLDCNQPLAVVGARTLTGLPYMHAHMSSAKSQFIDYSCQRAGTDACARYRYRGAGHARPAQPESLEFFLLERYYLFTQRRGSLLRGQVWHEPYRYEAADVEECSTIPAQLDGFAEVEDSPCHCCYVSGVDVKIFATQLVRQLGG